MGTKVVFQNSGGLDSLVVACLLYNQGYEALSVFLDMGQQNLERAKASAQEIADKYCTLGHEVVTLSSNRRTHFDTPNMIREGLPIKTRIPYAATTTAVLIATVAINENITYIASGTRQVPVRDGDYGYKENLRKMLSGGMVGEEVVLLQPLAGVNSIKDVVKIGLEQGLTIEEMNKSVSCNTTKPCLECSKCTGRKAAGLEPN